MNPNFISVEALLNQDGEPVPTPDPASPNTPPIPNQGNLVPAPPGEAGFITKLQKGDHTHYYCTISYDVNECAPYYNLINLLWTANENDVIELDIYSYGGQVETGCHIIAGMLNTKAKVITCAYSLCCSIAAMIWTCGKTRIMMPDATLMFHMPSGGTFGKTADNMEESKNIQDWFTYFMREATVGILTEEELHRIVTCRNDLFLSAKIVNDRMAQSANGTESLQSHSVPAGHWVEYQRNNSVSFEGVSIDCCDVPCSGTMPARKRTVTFTRMPIADNKVAWTFFLTEQPNPQVISDFINKLHLPGEQDAILIHAPSELFIDDAEILVSALRNCATKQITISAPYILNSNAAYFATSGTKMIPNKYGIMTIGLPTIAAFGKVIDASNAVAMHKYRILNLLRRLQDNGVIANQDEFLHIVKEQGAICLFGNRLVEVTNNINAKINPTN